MADRIQIEVEEIRLRNYRAFAAARLRLSDVTFLVGRNGAGKSSILDAVELLREATTDSLENALDRRGGLLKVRRVAAEVEAAPVLGVALQLRLTFAGGKTTQVVYGFELHGQPSIATYVVHERLTQGSTDRSSFRREDGTFEASHKAAVSPPAGNLVLPLVARADGLWEQVLDTVRNLRSYELSTAAIASAPAIGDRATLASDGSNAGDVLKALQGTEDHSWIVRRLGALTTGVTDVRAEALLGRRVLRFRRDQAGGAREFDASQVSQGTLRGLGVFLALRQQPAPALVLLDEIENSVHPSALAVLLEAAAASTDRTRVVLTSHSPEALGHPAVTGERVRVVEWRDGISNIYRLSPETQAAINEIDTVGWMLRTNALWTAGQPDVPPDDFFALVPERSDE